MKRHLLFALKTVIWCVAFIAIAIGWYYVIMPNLGAWAYYELYDLDKPEPVLAWISEIAADISRFPSVCIELWQSRFIIVGWVIDSVFWAFLIIYLCRRAVRFITMRVSSKKTAGKTYE